MARESKRHRDEKRFGKPERLVDRLDLATNQWISPPWLLKGGQEQARSWESYVRWLADTVRRSSVVKMDNVVQYVFDHFGEKFNGVSASMFPCLKLPFPLMWFESRRPSRFLTFESGDAKSMPAGFPQAWGWLCIQRPAEAARSAECIPERAELVLEAELIKLHAGDDRPHGPYCITRVFTDARGVPVAELQGCAFMSSFADEDDERGCEIDWRILGLPAFLAISFMNCKNVTTTIHETDRHLNRERQKHGLKPFLRYHTIDIEPMKRVLRTEGKIESTGLKRALHICRGHFATYSEERPLFGKVAGTFWIPSHVRGTTEEGIVVSDYQVLTSISEQARQSMLATGRPRSFFICAVRKA
jgi:hypothetical protein